VAVASARQQRGASAVAAAWRWGRQLGGGGSTVAAVQTSGHTHISSMIDGLKSCDVEAFYVCDFFTLICESRSIVPRGPPRLTYL
jgi:hypothetical protein